MLLYFGNTIIWYMPHICYGRTPESHLPAVAVRGGPSLSSEVKST